MSFAAKVLGLLQREMPSHAAHLSAREGTWTSPSHIKCEMGGETRTIEFWSSTSGEKDIARAVYGELDAWISSRELRGA
jgi:hypothetical protein